MKILIIAPHYRYAQRWADERPITPQDWEYVQRPGQIYGYRSTQAKYVMIGHHADVERYDEKMDALHRAGIKHLHAEKGSTT